MLPKLSELSAKELLNNYDSYPSEIKLYIDTNRKELTEEYELNILQEKRNLKLKKKYESICN